MLSFASPQGTGAYQTALFTKMETNTAVISAHQDSSQFLMTSDLLDLRGFVPEAHSNPVYDQASHGRSKLGDVVCDQSPAGTLRRLWMGHENLLITPLQPAGHHFWLLEHSLLPPGILPRILVTLSFSSFLV